MTNYSLTLTPNAVVWGQILNERRFTAESGSAKFAGRNGDRFTLTAQWYNMTGARRQALDGLLLGLGGARTNRVQVLPSVLGYKRRGSGGGAAILLNTSFSAGVSYVTADGATAGVTNWMRAGDWFTIKNELHKIIADVNSNGSGIVGIEFWPPLFTNMPDNEPVIVAAASVYGLFFQTAPIAIPASPFNATDFISDNITLSLEQDIDA